MFSEDEEGKNQIGMEKPIIKCHSMVLCYATKIFNLSSFVMFVEDRRKTKTLKKQTKVIFFE